MGKYDELVGQLRGLHERFAGQAGRSYTAALFGEAATAITTLEAQVRKQAMDYLVLSGQADEALAKVATLEAELAAMKARGDRLAEALERIALGITIELDDEDGPVNVWMDAEELSDLARQALTEWRDQ